MPDFNKTIILDVPFYLKQKTSFTGQRISYAKLLPTLYLFVLFSQKFRPSVKIFDAPGVVVVARNHERG